ncbi:MAG: Sigma-E factor negative regulatory protein-like protein [Ramlibacter sp.]|nr:Sigma-E factor negative regulatory protein-like protein [Ramlibacter sp.]
MEAMDKMDNREIISALADGQLQGEAFVRGVQAAAADAQARQAWCAYHVVGEVLRTGRASAGSPPEDFLARLQQRLRDEQPLAAPLMTAPAPVRPDRAAANDWRWKLVAGFASVAAVTAVGLNMIGAPVGNSAQPQLAAAPGAAAQATQASASSMIRDPRLDQLLAAHRQFGGATALQSSSGFLRNATFEAPAR